MSAVANFQFHNSKWCPLREAAPVLAFGGNWNFGTIFAFFLLYLLMKENYWKTFHNSKNAGQQATARLSGQGGFWKLGGLMLVNAPTDYAQVLRANQRNYGAQGERKHGCQSLDHRDIGAASISRVLPATLNCGAQDPGIRLVADFLQWSIIRINVCNSCNMAGVML